MATKGSSRLIKRTGKEGFATPESQKRLRKEFEEQERKSLVPRKDTEREVIKLQPKKPEKTGISALREEDTLIGNAVRVATDWRTTVALLGTLAVIGAGIGLAAGATARVGAAATATVPKGILQVAKQVNVNAIGKAAGLTSKQTAALAVQVGRERINVIARYAVNPKSTALTTSMLTKAGMAVGVAAFTATAVGTYPFAHFELAEATDKIGIAIFKAADAGDVEEVARLQEYLIEMVNPSVWGSIVNKIPFANVFNNVKKNVAAALVSAESILQSTEKKLVAAEEERIKFEKIAKEKEERDIQIKADIEESRRISEETFQRRQEEIEEGVEARDIAETEKFAKIEEERKERERLETLFFEAIRKRNAGLELTEEERQILIDRGVSPEPLTKTETTFRRRSRVKF